MREFSLNYKASKATRINNESAILLKKTRSLYSQRSSLIWAEHCSECAMPSCFSSCEYYAPRMDLKCQRFENGIRPVTSDDGTLPEAMSVTFKKWGKLEAAGIAKINPAMATRGIKLINNFVEDAVRVIPLPYSTKLFVTKALNKVLQKLSAHGSQINSGNQDTKFMIETLNQSNTPTSVSLTIRETSNPTRFFQKLIIIPSGYSQILIDISELSSVTLTEKCLYQIEPSAESKLISIVFGMLDFVVLKTTKEAPSAPLTTTDNKAQKVKCVVWDLDNTLWNGTLVEDGIDGIVLRPEMVSMITKLDEMGVLNAIASKNNHDDAMAALKRFGLDQYFLYPQISWNPKSNGIKVIQKSLNIGMDTIIFIDDQVFERTEVESMLPEIRVFSDKEATTLLSRPEFDIPVTEESKERRKMYQENVVREQALETAGEDYTSFLKSCEIKLSFERLNEETLNRVNELSQRTNQMNFSGNRYTKSQLIDIMNTPSKKTFVISCEDRFGSYGIVGFSIVDDEKALLMDLMFSCRIQAKQVEHTFIKYLLAYYADHGSSHFNAHYRPTPKNAQSGKVFSDVGFVLKSETDGLQTLEFDLKQYTDEAPVMDIIDNALKDGDKK